jgi:ribosomal protein S18 acetylase RimI-like enzyme
VRKDHWKGMSAEQLSAIKRQQEAQLEAKHAADAAAAAAEAEGVARSRDVQRAMLLQAQAAELARRQQAAAVAAALRDQMAAKVAKDAQTNTLYANKVRAEHCSQHSFLVLGQQQQMAGYLQTWHTTTDSELAVNQTTSLQCSAVVGVSMQRRKLLTWLKAVHSYARTVVSCCCR